MPGIDVPFYRQTMDFTCGSACIIMTLSHYDSGFPLNRISEMDIWREGTSVLVMGMGRYGLAFPLLKRGLSVAITTNSRGVDFMPRIEKRLEKERLELFKKLYMERKERAIAMGLVEHPGDHVTAADAADTIRRGGVPILLTDAGQLDDDEAPHWVVVTGISGTTFTLNNPLDSKGNREFSMPDFQRISGFDGEETLVSVFGSNSHSQVG